MTDTKEVAIRGGTQAEQDGFTGVLKEVTFDTTNLRLRAHDQMNPGGMVIPNRRDSQNQAFYAAVAGGTANALTLDFGVVNNPKAYAKFQRFVFEASANNTTTATLNVGSLGDVGLRKVDRDGAKQELEEGDIVGGRIYPVTHDGSHFMLGVSAGGGDSSRVLLAESTATGGATIDFTSGIDDTYDVYEIEILGLDASTTGTTILQFSADGGSTWLTTTYDWAVFSWTASQASSSDTRSTGTSSIRVHNANHTTADRKWFGHISLFGLRDAAAFSYARVDCMGIANFDGTMIITSGWGVRRVAQAINAVRLTPPGTVDSGTVRLWGVSKT